MEAYVLDKSSTGICILGGGPSGSALATRLAQLGHAVTVIESNKLRPQIGASLPPSIIPAFDVLGIRDAVENAGFIRTNKIKILWENERPELRFRPGLPGFHVERPRFDALMLNHAKKMGIRVLDSCHALSLKRLDDDTWNVKVKSSDDTFQLHASFVVDASGTRLLPEGIRKRMSPKTIALYGDWSVHEIKTYAGCIEAFENRWAWSAPVSKNRIAAAVFVDPEEINKCQNIDELYIESIKGARIMGSLFQKGQLLNSVTPRDTSFWSTTPAVVEGALRVGDSCLKVDPLSSNGITLGITASLQAAVVINTILKYPENEAIAKQFYNENQNERCRDHLQMAQKQYQKMHARFDSPFWVERSGEKAPDESEKLLSLEAFHLEQKLMVSPLTCIKPTPVVNEESVGSHHAVYHPMLKRPVAFLGEANLHCLLLEIEGRMSVRTIVARWEKRLPLDLCHQILKWLWQRRILISV